MGGGCFITGCGRGTGGGYYLVVFVYFTCAFIICSLMSSVPFFK